MISRLCAAFFTIDSLEMCNKVRKETRVLRKYQLT